MGRLFGSMLLVCLFAATVPAGGTHIPGDEGCPVDVECPADGGTSSAATSVSVVWINGVLIIIPN